MELFAGCYAILASDNVATKLETAASLGAAARAGDLVIDRASDAPIIDTPNRPALPELIPPQDVPRRGVGTPAGNAAFVHAIAHIEFNAIHLAVDACARFRDQPQTYYLDWIGVAAEEAYHFSLLAEILERRGFPYGSFPAHNGLWELAARTTDDVLARIALVPRITEARGLDVTPAIQERFATMGDTEVADALAIILNDEIGHVAIGNRWYRTICAERGLEPEAEFDRLVEAYRAPGIHPPLNRAARLAAGFTASELDGYEATAAARRRRLGR
jgi:uncharacterized ferritin-like protein (DUF455 family)